MKKKFEKPTEVILSSSEDGCIGELHVITAIAIDTKKCILYDIEDGGFEYFDFYLLTQDHKISYSRTEKLRNS